MLFRRWKSIIEKILSNAKYKRPVYNSKSNAYDETYSNTLNIFTNEEGWINNK